MIRSKIIPITGNYKNKPKVIYKGHRNFLSPYDIPQMALVSYDEEKHNFSIMFRYLTPDEETEFIVLDNEISIRIGKKSGKLYTINIYCKDKHKLRNLEIEIEEKVDEFINKSVKNEPSNQVQIMNFDLAKDIMKREKEIFAW